MKKIFYILAAAAAILLTGSCLGDKAGNDSYRYSLSAFGKPAGNDFLTDEGAQMVFTRDNTDKGWKSLSRLYIEYTLQKDASDSEPSIYLDAYKEVGMKSLLMASITPETEYGNDPVLCYSASLSGHGDDRYLNFDVYYPFVKDSGKTHKIDILYDDVKSTAADVHLYIKHDAAGETIADGAISANDVTLSNVMFSIPFTQVVPEGASSSLTLTIHYDWFSSGNTQSGYSEEISSYTINGTIKL